MRHAMKFVKHLRAILLCNETGFLTEAPSTVWYFQWMASITVRSSTFLPVISMSSVMDSLGQSLRCFAHTRVCPCCYFCTSFISSLLSTLSFIYNYYVFPFSIEALLEWSWTFQISTKPQRTVRMTFCQVIANPFQTSLKIR